jgi:LacI family transcriptional regulator
VPSATIRDVAKLAGVSTATVSRVINGNYYVSPEIVDKVRSAIKELNYFPNSVARSLKNDSTHTIGFLVSDISNNYFTTIAKVVEDIVSSENYNIIMCSTEDDKNREYNYLKLLIEKKVDGLIINTTGENDDFITSISHKIPVVLINRRVYNTEFSGDFIDSSNVDGVNILTSHLISMGHRRIGIINGDPSVSTGKERYAGFVTAMESIGVTVDQNYPYSFSGRFSVESGYDGAAYLLGMEDPPTGIVIMNNSLTIGVMKYLREKNIKVPDNISIASYGNIDNIEVMYIQPSIVTLNPRLVGEKAGHMILERISKNVSLNREVIFTPQLLVGNTVRRI